MTLSLILAAALAAPLAPQHGEDLNIHSDAHLVQSDPYVNPTFSWSTLTSNTYNRSRPGGNWVGTKYYLIGGELLSSTWGTSRAEYVEIFDGVTGTWSTSASSMPYPASNIMGSTAASGGKIYVFGGYDAGANYLSDVQIYDTTTDSWSVSSALLPGAGKLGVLAVEVAPGMIFVCGGGTSGGGAVSDAYYFDTTTETFTTAPSMPSARRYITGDADNGKVVAAAGFGTGTVVEMYDHNTMTWYTMASLPVDRAGCGVLVTGPYCVMIGGDWSGYRSDANVLNIVTNTYNPTIAASLGSMAVGRRAFAYGLFERGKRRAFIAADGYAAAFLGDVEALQ